MVSLIKRIVIVYIFFRNYWNPGDLELLQRGYNSLPLEVLKDLSTYCLDETFVDH